MVVAGLAEIFVGVLHFVMPPFYQRSEGLGALNSPEADYVILVTYATGLLLITFGVLTMGALTVPDLPYSLLFAYLMIQAVLWAARLLLEILFPLKLDMFGIDPFTAVVLPGLTLETGIFIAAASRVRVVADNGAAL